MKVKKSRGRLISSKRGIVVRGEWKAVNMDPGLFSEEGLDGLVCFEELTDYSLVEPERAVAVGETSRKDKKKKKKKRKASEIEAEEELQSDAEEIPDEKNKRQKKNKRDEESQDETVEDSGLEDQISQDESSDVTPETQQKTSKKKKKKKQQKKKTTLAGKADAPAESKKKSRNWSSAAVVDPEGSGTDVSAWKDLFVPAPVLKALSELGFSAPTPIQALALPPAIRDRLDVLGAAETGSGKTLCFGIPMIHMILEWKEASSHKLTDELRSPDDAEPRVESLYLPKDTSPAQETSDEPRDDDGEHDEPRDGGGEDDDGEDDEPRDAEGDDDEPQDGGGEDCNPPDEAGPDACAENEPQKQPLLGLILTPTRELAVQVKHHIDAVARFTGIKTAIVVGGMATQKQQRMLMRRPEIVIATPGRLWEMIKEKQAHLQNLRQLRY